MATKKKPAPKKPARPAGGAAKPAPKKVASKKPAAKKTVKKSEPRPEKGSRQTGCEASCEKTGSSR